VCDEYILFYKYCSFFRVIIMFVYGFCLDFHRTTRYFLNKRFFLV